MGNTLKGYTSFRGHFSVQILLTHTAVNQVKVSQEKREVNFCQLDQQQYDVQLWRPGTVLKGKVTSEK